MRLTNIDELDIAIYESFVFGRLMEFQKGEKNIDETADLIVEDAEEAIKEQLKDAPTVDAEPVRHGRWITDSCPMDDGDYLMTRCTACGTAIEYGMGTPYCPFCGAKMDEGEHETD